MNPERCVTLEGLCELTESRVTAGKELNHSGWQHTTRTEKAQGSSFHTFLHCHCGPFSRLLCSNMPCQLLEVYVCSAVNITLGNISQYQQRNKNRMLTVVTVSNVGQKYLRICISLNPYFRKHEERVFATLPMDVNLFFPQHN